ncbi:hypothetical protein PIB30_067984 [Stylosanthes scabra]|uniref:Uncharacterized protein n=1 Tax=Stylosanthes scabra TaxID=79078 RepID=A0ABU6ZM13_9FABA|nr:hypothetical protein [Stylosanthes scabra]
MPSSSLPFSHYKKHARYRGNLGRTLPADFGGNGFRAKSITKKIYWRILKYNAKSTNKFRRENRKFKCEFYRRIFCGNFPPVSILMKCVVLVMVLLVTGGFFPSKSAALSLFSLTSTILATHRRPCPLSHTPTFRRRSCRVRGGGRSAVAILPPSPAPISRLFSPSRGPLLSYIGPLPTVLLKEEPPTFWSCAGPPSRSCEARRRPLSPPLPAVIVSPPRPPF